MYEDILSLENVYFLMRSLGMVFDTHHLRPQGFPPKWVMHPNEKSLYIPPLGSVCNMYTICAVK